MGITFLGARAATYAAISTFFSVIFTVIAFSTPYWLAADGRSSRRIFLNLGLWEACFTSFRDPNYQYDRELRGCKWLFDEDYTFLLDVLEPPFFVATQVLYTIGFVFLLMAVIGTLGIELCFITDREAFAMRVLSCIMFLSGLFCTTAVIIFGIKGDDRDWMPDPEHNFLSWSFALAVVGCFCHWIASVLFLVESRVLKARERKRSRTEYGLERKG